MSLGVSMFVFALGAVLYWGIQAQPRGVDIDIIGIILMSVGAVGFFLSLFFWSSFAPFRRTTMVEEREPLPNPIERTRR